MVKIIDVDSAALTADMYKAVIEKCYEKVNERISDDIKADPSINGEVALMYLDAFKNELLQLVKEVE